MSQDSRKAKTVVDEERRPALRAGGNGGKSGPAGGGAQRVEEAAGVVEDDVRALRDVERGMVGVLGPGEQHGAHPGAASGRDVAVHGVAHVPGAARFQTERVGGDLDHPRGGLADAHLVGVDLHVDEGVEAALRQYPAMAEAGVSVGDHPHPDALSAAVGEQLRDAGPYDVVRHSDRHHREQLGGLRDHQLAGAVGEVCQEELPHHLAVRHLPAGRDAGRTRASSA